MIGYRKESDIRRSIVICQVRRYVISPRNKIPSQGQLNGHIDAAHGGLGKEICAMRQRAVACGNTVPLKYSMFAEASQMGRTSGTSTVYHGNVSLPVLNDRCSKRKKMAARSGVQFCDK